MTDLASSQCPALDPGLLAAQYTDSRTSSTNLYTPWAPLSHRAKENSLNRMVAILEPLAKKQRAQVSRRQDSVSAEIGKRKTNTLGVPRKRALASSAKSTKPKVQLPPAPARPGRPLLSRKKLEGKSTHVSPREEVSVKPYSLDAPKSAPRSVNQATLDFYSWQEGHPGDLLNEQTVKSGHYDKASISQGETGSARPIIWSSVKHKSGLQVLSSLYVSSLDQRRLQTTVHSRSTFKPPPRVTLTDAKREAWLKDLADPRIPLRRLSRTIPHGIRGKALLDHCLAKKIPTWRAVWLAKCVGANEIRAFKRKGTSGAFALGGETKWIRDWTTHVEQFIESLMESCGSNDWKSQMTYGLQLAAHVYFDHLLDQDAFVEWITAGIQNSHEASLPMWLILVTMYCKHIPATRRLGYCLAIAMLEQLLQQTRTGFVEANKMVWHSTTSMIYDLMIKYPEFLVLPIQWHRYENALFRSLVTIRNSAQTSFEMVSSRNSRCRKDAIAYSNETFPYKKVISYLELASQRTINLQKLSDTFIRMTQDQQRLVATLIQWSTAKLRQNVSRVYLAVRILRQLARLGFALDDPITAILASTIELRQLDISKVYLLVSELVRSYHFSMGKYLQWLLAKGSLASSEGAKIQIELLNNIALTGLSETVLNLRAIVLAQMCRSLDIRAEVSAGEQLLKDQLANPSKSCGVSGALDSSIRSLCGSAKAEIALRMRKNVLWQARQAYAEDRVPPFQDFTQAALLLQNFQIVVSAIESLGDYSVLADILHIYVDRAEISTLPIVVDSINCRYDVLHALGAVKPLLATLLVRMAGYPERTLGERPLFSSLIMLAERTSNSKDTVIRLQQELALCEPISSLAACSPVSDQMVEALHYADTSFVEELELLFNSGTSMDRSLLAHIFSDLTQRIEDTQDTFGQPIASLIDLLTRLRSFEDEFFEDLILDWFEKIIPSQHVSNHVGIAIGLVSGGAVALKSIIAKTSVLLRSFAGHVQEFATDLLEVLLIGFSAWIPKSSMTARFEVERAKLTDSPRVIVPLIERVISWSQIDCESRSKARNIVENSSFPEFLQNLFADAANKGYSLDEIVLNLSTCEAAKISIDTALGLSSKDCGYAKELRTLFSNANEINIILSQIRLRLLTAAPDESPDVREHLVQALVDEATQARPEKRSTWSRLFAMLSPDVALDVHAISWKQIYQSLRKEVQLEAKQLHPEIISNLVAVIESTEKIIPTTSSGKVLDDIASVLMSLQNCYLVRASMDGSRSNNDSSRTTDCTESIALYEKTGYLETILELLSIHRRAIQHQLLPPAVFCQLIITLSFLLTASWARLSAHTAQFLFDVIALISDYLPSESRLYCGHVLRGQYQINDTRVDYLLGTSHGEHNPSLSILVPESSKTSGASKSATRHQTYQYRLKNWEMVQDATPVVGENDTSLSLTLFEARKRVEMIHA